MAARYLDEEDQLKYSVFVSNLPLKIQSEAELKSFFERFGQVTDVAIIIPRYKNRFAFVTFSEEKFAKDAVKAAKTKGVYCSGKRLWIAPKEDRRGMLVKGKEKAEEKTGPDLTEILNNDCMLYIFTFLDPPDILRCEQVSKRWQHISLQSLAVLKELCFGNSKHMITTGYLEKVLKIAAEVLTSFHFDWLGYSQLSCLKKFNLPNVSKLTIGTFPRDGRTCFDQLKNCMPSLKTLLIKGHRANDECLTQLMNSFPGLEELKVGMLDITSECFADWTSLRKLTISNTGFNDTTEALSKLPIGLEQLQLSASSYSSKPLHMNCPNLRKLTVDGDVAVEQYLDLSQAPKLEELSINVSLIRSTRSLNSLRANSQGLKKLDLSLSTSERSLQPADINGLWQLMSELPHLIHLNLSNTRITGMIKDVPKLKKLQTLLIRGTEPAYQRDLISLINELPELRYLDISGVKITDGLGLRISDIEALCNECIADTNRPTLELVIASCELDKGNKLRWKCGRFIIYNPKWERVTPYYSPPSSDYDYDGYVYGYDYDDSSSEDYYDSDRYGGYYEDYDDPYDSDDVLRGYLW